jgi:hypothetical protein
MEKELFALLRLGLAITTTEEENLSDFIVLTADKWARIGDLARKQGVLGIMLDGVDKLEATRYRLTRDLTAAQKLEWIGEVMQIEQRNSQQIVVMNDLTGKWKQQGCRVMVMKGQANGFFYPKSDHRNPGDIDCYLMKENDNQNENAYQIGNKVAREAGAKVDESWYKHSVINYKGETFENHQYFVHTRDGKRGKQLEKELEEALKVDASLFKPLTSIAVMPPVQWTAMFLTYHACAHFVSEGLRLKQILDWAMFLKKHQDDVNWDAFFSFCDRNHLRVFAEAMNTIARKFLGIKIERKNLVINESPYSDKIMHSALYDDDYVFGSGKSGWANRLHLVRNMFRYRWKYEEVYQTSVWKQLWWYASGFLFKTE